MNPGGGAKTGLSRENTVDDLETAWKEREAEASALASRYPSIALALRLDALEIRLKTIICRTLKTEFPPNHCRTHDLAELLLFTGRSTHLDDRVVPGLRQNWDRLVTFSRERLNNLRYSPNITLSAVEVKMVIDAFGDSSNGVWTWLSALP